MRQPLPTSNYCLPHWSRSRCGGDGGGVHILVSNSQISDCFIPAVNGDICLVVKGDFACSEGREGPSSGKGSGREAGQVD